MFKHLCSTATCFNLYNSLSCKTIDKASSVFNLKIKEAWDINYRPQQNHLALTLLLQLDHHFIIFCLCFFVSVYVFFFHLLFLLSLTLIICIFNCLNYASLLLNIITMYLASHLSLLSIIFVISTLFIGIFYCLN